MIEYFVKRGSKYVTGQSRTYSEFRDKKSNSFTCFLIEAPDEHQIKEMCKDFNLDQRPFHKFKTENRSLRYNFNPLTFILTDYYTTQESQIKMARLLLVIRDNLLILAVSESASYYRDMFKKIIDKAQSKKHTTTASILYEFLHQDAKENYDVIEEMDDKLVLLEQKIISGGHADKLVIHDIFSTKKELIKMSKRLWASSKIIFTIKKELTSIKLTAEERALLDDIYDTFLHQIDMIETQKETVTDYLEIFTTTVSNKLALISNELNSVMKKMAALTIIIMVPTLIAGIYGMNFHNLPEISWKYGYLFAIALMALCATTTYYLFHKKGWI